MTSTAREYGSHATAVTVYARYAATPLRRDCYEMFSWLVLFAVFTAAQGRAVNISNAWVLPEEGFPVFYRYFRDRISWYEADAVCQFHHANLVTVDTTAQYDAVRAYLKELDISTAVWVGLIRSNPDGEFTWTDYRGLSGDGYWSSAPDTRTAPLCAAANPGADYRWEARSCGGPTVASFICELPVPQWALGNEGCMVQNIPALTILYLPESAAVQLTADCGLAEVKKVQCTGNVKREVLLKDLACVEEETTTTSLKIITSDITTERENTSDITPEDITTLSTSEKLINKSTSTVTTLFDLTTTENTNSDENKLDKVYMNKNIHIDFISHNNIQSNDIPRIAGKDDDFIEEQLARKEDAKTKQLLMMHEELARHGNFANNDHFVPPLVMAKAKLNDDMTVLSVQEKHAQQLAQQGVLNYKNTHKEIVPLESEITKSHNNKEEIKEEKSITKKADISSNVKKDTIIKSQIPKKYNEKYISIKGKYTNPMETKNEEIITSQPSTKITIMEPTTMVNVNKFYKITTDNPVELKVVFKEPVIALHSSPIPYTDIPHTDNIIKLVEPESVPSTESDNINVTTESQSTSYKLNDEIIKITVIKGADSPQPFTTEVFEVSTKVPVFYSTEDTTHTTGITVTEQNTSKSGITEDTTVISTSPTTTIIPSTQTNNLTSEHSTPSDVSITTEAPNFVNITETENSTFIDINTSPDTNNATVVEDKVITNHTILTNGTEVEAEHGTDSLEEEIDDKNSPLLSGASEPLRRPPRIRRPQQQNNIKKFNPFRILG